MACAWFVLRDTCDTTDYKEKWHFTNRIELPASKGSDKAA
jgi:hypothetical protein